MGWIGNKRKVVILWSSVSSFQCLLSLSKTVFSRCFPTFLYQVCGWRHWRSSSAVTGATSRFTPKIPLRYVHHTPHTTHPLRRHTPSQKIHIHTHARIHSHTLVIQHITIPFTTHHPLWTHHSPYPSRTFVLVLLLSLSLSLFQRDLVQCRKQIEDTAREIGHMGTKAKKEFKDYVEAQSLFEKARDGYELCLGADHATTLTMVTALAVLFEDQVHTYLLTLSRHTKPLISHLL